MLQWIRSVTYTVLLFAVTGIFGVIVLVAWAFYDDRGPA